MAPKEKKAPAKPTAKVSAKASAKASGKAVGKAAGKAAVKKGPTKIDPAVLAKHKKIYVFCFFLSVLSIVASLLFAHAYFSLKERHKPIADPFEVLRDSLSTALQDNRFKDNEPKKVAEEVRAIPSKTEKSSQQYLRSKEEYKSLFSKPVVRSYSTHWKLHGKSFYYFSKGEKTWYDAEDFCLSRGAHLASILNNEEQNFVTSQLQHTSWIGLKVENEKDQWRWSDGSRLVKEYWSEDKSSNTRVFMKSNQDCAMIVPSLTYHNWRENNCHKLYRWVCKETLDLGEQQINVT